jgi:cytochrome bd ubiquinol oxidase subunit I
VLGPLFTYEVMTAFFIEAGFLGVMLFGWDRVTPKLHYLATLLVLIGTTLSAYWILSANSWMQHPIGFVNYYGKLVVDDWYDIVFNPATFPRFIHMMLASYISAGFVIASVSAYYLLSNRFTQISRTCFSFIWTALLILTPLQIFIGDATGIMVHDYQPLKTAAMEGLWHTEAGAPLLLFALPDQKNQINHDVIAIPHGAALINTHQWNGVLTGLSTVNPSDQPPVWPVFFAFRIMVGCGLLMFALAIVGFYLKVRKKLYDTTWFLIASIFSAPLGFLALWCGWITAEIGRQPWIVYNLIRTNDAVSPVSVHNVMITFGLIFVVYGIIFGFFYFYFLHKIIQNGPTELKHTEPRQPFQYMPVTINSEPKE